MPINGLLAAWDCLEWGVTSSASHSGYGLHSRFHDAELETQYVNTTSTTALGIRLSVSTGETGGSGNWLVRYEGPNAPPGGWTDSGLGFRASLSLSVRFRGVELYALGTGSGLRFSATDIELWVDGVLATTLGGASLTSSGCGPAYIPVAGIPAHVSGGNAISGESGPGSFDFDLTLNQVVSGGWRFRVGTEDDWQLLPVTLPPFDVPAGSGCSFGLASPAGIVVSEYTWGEHLHQTTRSVAFRNCPSPGATAPATVRGETARGDVWLFPDLPRRIGRLNECFAVLAERGGFPAATLWRARDCDDGVLVLGASGGGESHETVVAFPSTGARLNVLRNGPHDWEAPFGVSLWAPCRASRTITTGANPETLCGDDPAYIPGPGEATAVVFPSSVESISENPDLIGAWHHDNPLVRYWTTWGHPHWSTFAFFAHWPVDGEPMDRNEFWSRFRTQWLEHSSLPALERTKSRSSLFACALEQSAHTPFLDTFVGGRRWLGVHRFQVDVIAVDEEIATDPASEPRLSVEGGEVTGLDPLTMTADTGVEEITVWFDLLSLEEPPYLAPGLAVTWRWPVTSGVAATTRFVTSRDEGTVYEENEPPEVDRPFLRRADAVYVGGWAIDDGGGTVDDQGSDTELDGASSTWLSEPIRSALHGLFGGRQGAKVGLRLTLTSPGGTAELEWPVFRRSPELPRFVREQPMRGTHVWPLGPVWRAGHWDWYDDGWINPPAILGQPFVSTVIDHLAAKRCVWEGTAPTDGVADELTHWFTATEGNTLALAEPNSFTFPWMAANPLELRTAIVNTVAEVPPLAHFPVRSRSANGVPDGEWAQETWVGADEPRWWLANESLRLLAPGGEDWLTDSAPGVPGWRLRQHQHALDHTEPEFEVHDASGRIALVRPWRGVYAITRIEPDIGTALAADVGPDQRSAIAYLRGNELRVRVSDHLGNSLTDSGLGHGADAAAIRFHRSASSGPLTVWWTDEGALLFKSTLDAGNTWTSSTTIMETESHFPAAWISPDGLSWLYWVVGSPTGVIYGELRDTANNVLVGPVAIVGVGTVETEGVATAESFENDGRRRITLWVKQEDEIRAYRSYDGQNFA
ncbi:MAG: hypothetical protein KF812_02200 [Fimbriimonadaceae bacterium]|nr:hypothetical protein [Fimbriimonadaceae bacterium]